MVDVTGYLQFVKRIAWKYQRQDLEMEDLIAAGNLGLMEAAHRYDPAKSKFTTYSHFWINWAIIRYIQKSRVVHESIHIQEKQIKNDEDSIIALVGFEDWMAYSDEDIFLALYVQEIIGLSDLTNKEQYIIQKIYWDELLPQTIAKHLNLSRQGVVFLHRRALKKMRRYILAAGQN